MSLIKTLQLNGVSNNVGFKQSRSEEVLQKERGTSEIGVRLKRHFGTSPCNLTTTPYNCKNRIAYHREQNK